MKLLALVPVFFLAACDGEAPAPKATVPPEPVAKSAPPTPQILYQVVKPGEPGTEPKAGDMVTIHFAGSLTNGRVFADTRQRGKPFEFMLGVGMVIEGWEEALPHMTVGSRIKLQVPWQLGYGEQGTREIPPRADLQFVIELLAVRPGADIPPFPRGNPATQKKTETGLRYEVLHESEAPAPDPDRSFKLRYSVWNTRGQLLACTETQDRHLTGTIGELRMGPKPEPFLQEAAKLMRPGAVYRFEVPPELCWGAAATHKRLPPSSPTVWELELVGTGEVPKFRELEPPVTKTTESGLEYEIIREGGGSTPDATSEIEVNYTGWLADGTRFDSSHARMEPARFRIGKVIPGWQEGLCLMKEGAIYLFRIPPELAYGDKAVGERIPPNATLYFLVELIKVHD